MNKERIHFSFNVSEYLKKFMDTHPELGNPTYFYYLAYPIAKVELDIMENVIENFEVLEKYILSYLNVSSFNLKDIANFSGIPLDKIKATCKSLQATGLITSDNKITDLGKKSLKESKKYSNVKRRMMVLVDGVCGVVLEEGSIYEKFMKEGQVSAFKKVPMLIPENELTDQNFSQFYENIDYNEEDSISTNFASIDGARVDGLFYVPLYMVGFEHLSGPILLNEFDKKFVPLYIFSKDATKFQERCMVVSDENAKLLKGVYNEIKEYFDINKEVDSFLKILDGESLEKKSTIRHVKIRKELDLDKYNLRTEVIGLNDYSEYPAVLDVVNGVIFYFQKVEEDKKVIIKRDGEE